MLPTLRGLLLLLAAAPILAVGTWAPALEWVALGYIAICLGLFLIDWWLAGSLTRFVVTREHDPRLSIGADNVVRLGLHNRAARATRFWLRDEPPDAFHVNKRILEGEVKPHAHWQSEYYVHPLRRGDYQFGALNLRWEGPLRLVHRQGSIPARETVKVYPNLLDVSRYELLMRRNRLQELGLRHSRMFGEGTEFERLREYSPDDEFRRINWKATARRNRPITTEYQTERSQNVIAMLDIGRMMQSPVAEMAKLDYVINAVLLLSYVATGKGDKVGLLTFADDVQQFIAPQPGRGQFYRLLEALHAVEPQPVEPDYQRALSYLAVKQHRRALIVIFTDLSGGLSLQTLVSHVAIVARRSLPLVVTISDPEVHAAAQAMPQDSLSVYQRGAASRLLEERQLILDSLRRRGVFTLDVPANQLSMAVINHYLELKGRTLL